MKKFHMVNWNLCIITLKGKQFKQYAKGMDMLDDEKWYVMTLHRDNGQSRFAFAKEILMMAIAAGDPDHKPTRTFYPEP